MIRLPSMAEDAEERSRAEGRPSLERAMAEAERDLLPVVRKLAAGCRDRQTLQEFRALLPRSRELTAAFGDLARRQTDELIDNSTDDAFERAALSQYVDDLREALGYAEASALERGLIDLVAHAWVRLWREDARYTCLAGTRGVRVHDDLDERRLDAAQRRYLRAVETLSRVRRLSARPLQINVGERQLNIAHAEAVGAR